MRTLSLFRRSLIGLCGAVLGLALMTTVGRTDEVAASASANGVVLHGPEETLRDYCRMEGDQLWLELPDGSRFELVTSTCGYANPGDGSFHPFDEATVLDALASVRYPLAGVSVQVFLLPYPRLAGAQSAAGPELMLLSPGVVPLTPEQQHAEVVHELGHVVQYQYMPDGETREWSRYRSLRGITDEIRFSADAVHADRPHEIFAEDFRALFGGALANYSGSIENESLCYPSRVDGLDAFMVSLDNAAPFAAGQLRGFPNPSRGSLSFRRGGDAPGPVDLFDLAGRRVASLSASPLANGWQWRWDGRDDGGQAAASGVMFARERGSASPAFRFIVAR
jgi:hypothetical protein